MFNVINAKKVQVRLKASLGFWHNIYHYTSGLRKLNLLISILKLSAEQIGWAVSEAITDDGKTEEEYIADY